MKKTLKEFLKKKRACEDGYLFAKDLTLEEFFATCHRGDWILWLFAKSNPKSIKELTLAKGHCANTVRYLMEDERSLRGVDVAIAFGEGKATKEELDSAYAAAYVAYTAADAAADAADAAADAADASYVASAASAAAADAASDASDASYVAYAAAYSAAAYSAADYKKNQMETADICRKYLPINIWNIK
jgi:hypothetical protein